MTDIAIRVRNLSKCFQVYSAPRDRLKQFILPHLQRIAGKAPKRYYREFWALKNISFEIKRGETVGIVGRNGSGKSTLLQLVCGTLSPTSGTVETHGRIAALLELGAGFNPEFTGRENVYMNAAVLGLSKTEIDERFGDIAAFADIGDFIEQPVKKYSSGMYIRLAFSVAINVDPEILIVDEALAVGDEMFQRKCFSKIEQIRNNGATVLFVSHSGGTIVELCDRAILIDSGEKLAVGLPKQIVGHYHKLLYAPADLRASLREDIRQSKDVFELSATSTSQIHIEHPDHWKQKESFDQDLMPNSIINYESRGAFIEAPTLLTLAGEEVNNLIRGRTYCYTYNVRFEKCARNVRFAMLIKTISGLELGGAISSASGTDAIPLVEAGKCIRVRFQFNANLNTGIYYVNAGVHGSAENEPDGYLHRMVDIAMFRILPSPSSFATAIVDFGCVPTVDTKDA